MQHVFSFLFLCFCFFVTSIPVHAQTAAQQGGVPQAVSSQIISIQKSCLPSRWQTPDCLKAMGESNLIMASNYAEALQNGDHKPAADELLQHCAASTAAREQEVPAYAMTSAMTECANTMGEIAQNTGIRPDPTHFQLFIAGVLCLSQNLQCAALEKGIAAFK